MQFVNWIWNQDILEDEELSNEKSLIRLETISNSENNNSSDDKEQIVEI